MLDTEPFHQTVPRSWRRRLRPLLIGACTLSAFAAASSAASAQTVLIGNQAVTVSPAGTVVIDGLTMPVSPTATHVWLALPPASSTPDATPQESDDSGLVGLGGGPMTDLDDGAGLLDVLPAPGVTGYAVTYPIGGLDDSQSVLSTTATTTPDADGGPNFQLPPGTVPSFDLGEATCVIHSSAPSYNLTSQNMKSSGQLICVGPAAEAVTVRVGSRIYVYDGLSGLGLKQHGGYALSPIEQRIASVTNITGCDAYSAYEYRSFAAGYSEYNGDEVNYAIYSHPTIVPCIP